jgi:hypothetical protein
MAMSNMTLTQIDAINETRRVLTAVHDHLEKTPAPKNLVQRVSAAAVLLDRMCMPGNTRATREVIRTIRDI